MYTALQDLEFKGFGFGYVMFCLRFPFDSQF